jgi:hypothetical protein
MDSSYLIELQHPIYLIKNILINYTGRQNLIFFSQIFKIGFHFGSSGPGSHLSAEQMCFY